MKKQASLTLLLMLAILLNSCGDLAETRSLKLAHGLDTNHPVHKGMEFMANRVKEKSGGKLLIEIYPSQQLGTERQTLELLQIGSLAMTKVSAAVMENFAPNIQVLSLPYIFHGRDHSFRVLDGSLGKKLLQQSEKYRLRGLTYFDAGYRSFYTKTPVHSPEDLKGKKIRVQESVSAMNLVRNLGGAPTPISWGELYTALQQGVVDGAENNPPSFYLSRHYEVCKYYCLNEHTAVPDILVIGTEIWDRLRPEEQNWIQEAADEAKVYQRKLWEQAEEHAFQEVQKAGVEIIRPDKTPFIDMTRSILESYRDQPEKYQIIQEIMAIQ